MIKVLIADDHKMFVDGLKSLLKDESKIEVVGEASNGDEVLEVLESIGDIDIIVLDIEMPNTNGIEVAKMLKKQHPKIKILVLTMHNRKAFILKLMEIGVSGYILKDRSKEELVGAIHNIHQGGSHFGLEILNTIANAKNETVSKIKLTKREEEVLCLIAEGLTSKEVAEKLFIAETTVQSHRKSIFHKLGISKETQLVRYAIREGYIKP